MNYKTLIVPSGPRAQHQLGFGAQWHLHVVVDQGFHNNC
jgi:hypothetical protein